MIAFTVTVRMEGRADLVRSAIASDAAVLIMDMLDRFGVCAVFVKPI